MLVKDFLEVLKKRVKPDGSIVLLIDGRFKDFSLGWSDEPAAERQLDDNRPFDVLCLTPKGLERNERCKGMSEPQDYIV